MKNKFFILSLALLSVTAFAAPSPTPSVKPSAKSSAAPSAKPSATPSAKPSTKPVQTPSPTPSKNPLLTPPPAHPHAESPTWDGPPDADALANFCPSGSQVVSGNVVETSYSGCTVKPDVYSRYGVCSCTKRVVKKYLGCNPNGSSKLNKWAVYDITAAGTYKTEMKVKSSTCSSANMI